MPPTPSPTLAPTIDQFCAQFDFGGIIDPNESSILEVAREDLQLSLMVSLFEVSGLDEIFRCPGTFQHSGASVCMMLKSEYISDAIFLPFCRQALSPPSCLLMRRS